MRTCDFHCFDLHHTSTAPVRTARCSVLTFWKLGARCGDRCGAMYGARCSARRFCKQTYVNFAVSDSGLLASKLLNFSINSSEKRHFCFSRFLKRLTLLFTWTFVSLGLFVSWLPSFFYSLSSTCKSLVPKEFLTINQQVLHLTTFCFALGGDTCCERWEQKLLKVYCLPKVWAICKNYVFVFQRDLSPGRIADRLIRETWEIGSHVWD